MRRPTLHQQIKKLGHEQYFAALSFSLDEGSEHRIKRFVEVEFTLYAAYSSGTSPLVADDLWILFVGWEELVLNKEADIHRVRRLRLLVNAFQSKSTWEEALSSYRKSSEKLRLFTIDEAGHFSLRTSQPVVCSDRAKIYEQILSAPLSRRIKKVTLAQPGKTYYYDRYETNSSYRVKIPEHLSIPSLTVKEKRKKRTLSIPLEFDWVKVGEEMDQVLKESGHEKVNYKKRLQKIVIQNLNSEEQEPINVTGLIHVLGGLGAGKSTWMVAMAYELIKRQGAKIGFIESSVANVNKRAKELRALDLSVVTFIGIGNRNDHEREHLDRKGLTLEDIAADTSLPDLSSLCLIEALAEDKTINNNHPCQSLYRSSDKRKRYACPLVFECGLYRQYADLEQADVWIATPASLISSRIPPQIDPQEPTLYEAFYDNLDIVFADEADALQEDFDQVFIRDESLFGDQGHLLENSIRKIRDALHGFYEPGGQFLTRYLRQSDAALDAARCLLQLVKEHPKIQYHLKNQISFKYQWEERVRKALEKWNPALNHKEIAKVLRNWGQKPFRSEPQRKLSKVDLHWYQKIEAFLHEPTSLSELLDLSPTNSLTEAEIRHIEAECRYYFWLCRFEYSFHFITTRFSELLSFVGNLEINFPFNRMKNPLLLHLPRPILGDNYGYRLVQEDESNQLIMKLIDYRTIGRFLLYRFPNLFKAMGDGPGPAVILLSGTTLAPRIAHYSLFVTPDYLISSTDKPSEIEQEFIPLSDPTGRLLRVSGMKPAYRQLALEEIARQLPSIIDAEMMHWNQKRGTILVTNSYQDSETVARSFFYTPIYGKIKALSRKVNDTQLHVTRPRLMEAAKEVDALIAPLSAMNRGVNLVDQEGKALFGTALFLSRPYPPPQDARFILSFIHSRLFELIRQIKCQGLTGKNALSRLRSICYATFRKIHDKPNFWRDLDEEERLDLAWYLFVPIWQMAGRLLRGSSPARLLYIDASFSSGENTPSLFQVWDELFAPYKEDKLYQKLYGPFLSSLENLVQQKNHETEVKINE